MRSQIKIAISILLVMVVTATFAQDEKKGGKILLQVVDNDSMHVLTATVLDSVTAQPLKDVALTFFVQRLFGLMQVGDGKTDSTGVITSEFKKDVRSDANNKLILIAKAEDDEVINNTAVQLELKPDLPYLKKNVAERAMFARHAPWWLVITFAAIVCTVWFVFAYVVLLIRRISKAGQPGIQPVN